MGIQRRRFLQVAGTAILSAGLPLPARAQASRINPVVFPQGVASGDPQPDSIMLWTRAEAIGVDTTELILQVAREESFNHVLVEETLQAELANDYTVRALVGELQPATHYYYRFIASGGETSRVGRTMTAPETGADRHLNLAFASCQNYEQGYFGAWSRMITDDISSAPETQIDCVLHLGDFIYERYRHGATEGQRFARRLPDFPDGAWNEEHSKVWAESLADYRHLYKTYLSDPHLQAARARWPFVCTWDDHEFSNNGYQDFNTYAEPHFRQPQRKRDANKAWFEYIPALVGDDTDQLTIYRSLRWGKQADLLITDLRSYRSITTLPDNLSTEMGLPVDPVKLIAIFDAGKTYNNGNPPEMLPFADGTFANTARDQEPATMLGAQQKLWFKTQLADSPATWKVWANSLPAMPLRLDLASLPFQGLQTGILTRDAWAGFPGELGEIMSFVETQNITGVVSLSGDHHMHGAASLMEDPDAAQPTPVAVDFNVTGISSTPQLSNVLASDNDGNAMFNSMVVNEVDGEQVVVWNMTLTQGVVAALAFAQSGWQGLADWLGPNSANPGLNFVDSNAHGYGIARFSAEQCAVELVTVADAQHETGSEGAAVLYTAQFALPAWKPGQQPELQGPEFSGAAPFPHS
jgi:alkaline phosphatase D